jgi:hypothetical protein
MPVSVVVAVTGNLGVIHDRAEYIGSNSLQAAYALPDSALASFLSVEDEQDSIPLGGKYCRIGDQTYRRSIYQNVVELFPDPGEKLCEAIGT